MSERDKCLSVVMCLRHPSGVLTRYRYMYAGLIPISHCPLCYKDTDSKCHSNARYQCYLPCKRPVTVL